MSVQHSLTMQKMKYRLLNKKEEDQVVIKILDTLLDSSIPFSGEHRKQQWEKGWGENLKTGDLTPKYFKYNIFRKNQRFITSDVKGFEQKMLHSIVDEMYWKYLYNSKDIYEFGCGTGHNLKHLSKLSKAKLHGFDWTTSSNKIIKGLGFDSKNFDFFEPDFSIGLQEDSAVITVAALEQTGTRFERFLWYIRRNKPKVVVHIEPIPELLDPTNLLDYLSIKYMEKRKYLKGYLDTLRILEKQGKIKIHEARRSGIGSLYIDGYSIIAWSPIYEKE